MSTDMYGDWIVYITKFENCYCNNIVIYQRTGGVYQRPDGGYFTDGGGTKSALDCFVPKWREDGTVKKICKLYDCEIAGDKEEMRALNGSQLIQAIIAIYTWMSLRGRLNEH